ncbi:MAG: hypothetical protein JXO22_00705 [Phycisphaerae bacterium]|nr:hypothetical protein [Phycisphaerae bacterium]
MNAPPVAAAEPDSRAACRRYALWLLLIAGAWQIAAAWRPVPWILERLTCDDTFLLLEVVHRWAECGYPTFDGLHRTNGFQAAWGIIVRVLAHATRDHILLLHLTLTLAALLNTLTGFLLWRFACVIEPRAKSGLWVLAFWTAFCLSGRPNLIGLENTLLGTLTAGMLLAVASLRRRPVSSAHWCLVAILLAAMCWTRLDSAVIVAIVWTGLCVWGLARRHVAPVVAASTILGTAAALLVLFNLWAGGTPTPVSGLVKRVIANRIEPTWSPAVLASAAVDTALLMLKQAAIGVGAIWPPALCSIARVGLLILALFAVARKRFWFTSWTAVWMIALVVHVLAFRLWLSAYHVDTLWYYTPQQLSACVWAGIICARMWPQAGVCVPVVIGLVKTPLAVAALLVPPFVETASANRLAAAGWLRDNVPPGARVASWNAGELAYFSRCTLINLDGLVNDREYLGWIKAGRGTGEYLELQGVDYVVDYARTADVTPSYFWAVLPRDEWRSVATFGERSTARQMIVRRVEHSPRAIASKSRVCGLARGL